MHDGSGRIKFPISEPAEEKRKSQIEEYPDYYKTPGVQHIAMAIGDILTTVSKLHEAEESIFGYTIFNNWTAWDIQ
jgi:4-hydroxyphenylpyruvate dioxygenase